MKEWSREERYRKLRDPSELVSLHDQIAKSPYRQTFHIQPVTGLLNDPNGFILHDGQWHLFYQWCPWGAVHGIKHWYHVVSKDLVTWTNLGVAIYPDTDADNKGAYSGSAYPTDGKVYLYYTGNHRDDDWTRRSYTCLVKMNDDGTIEKYTRPLFGPHPDYTEHQRDPKILYFEDQHRYVILLGAQTKDKKGCMIAYTSQHHNRDWKFAGQVHVVGYEDFGGMWECPSIEHIGDMDVLLFCPQQIKLPGRGEGTNHNGYLLGHMDWDTLTFTPEGSFHVLDFGFDFYAAECAANLEDPTKAVLSAWMGLPDVSYPVTDEENWSGCLTLPRELTIRGRRLIQRPMPQLTALREEELPIGTGILPGACELLLETTPDADHTIKLFCDEKHEGGIVLSYKAAERELTIDRSGMRQRFNEALGESVTRPLPNGLSTLRIFVDTSSVEIFVGDGDAVFTSRVFPTTDEHHFEIDAGTTATLWTLKRAVQDDFVV